MKKRRVVVTGIGLVTAFGTGKEVFWEAVKSGKSGVSRIQRFDASQFKCQIAGECPDFDPARYVESNELDRMDRVSQMAVTAASLAIEESRLSKNNGQTGVILGTALGGITSDDDQHLLLNSRGHRFVQPKAIPMIMYNAPASHIAKRFGLKGPGYTISTACASGSQAIGEAYRLIRDGYASAMVAGGADAPLSFGIFTAWCALRVLSTRNNDPATACRPFSQDRDGMVLAEGAGIIVLEELQSALSKSSDIYCEIIGYGSSNDVHHITQPEVDGEAMAIQNALDDASISTEDVDYINAHGTATITNDFVETEAIKKIFGRRAYSIPTSSTKSMTGHSMGAAGAIEFITCCLSLQYALIPPTINYLIPDPQCDLDYVPNNARLKTIYTVISNSFGFGGTNSVLVAKKYLV